LLHFDLNLLSYPADRQQGSENPFFKSPTHWVLGGFIGFGVLLGFSWFFGQTGKK